jgi:hypothetical protein
VEFKHILFLKFNYTPAPRRGRGVYCFTYVRLSFRPSKISDIWSQASYRKMNCELMLTYDTPAYMFNVYKNQPSRQTGSRNLIGPKNTSSIIYKHKKFHKKSICNLNLSDWFSLWLILNGHCFMNVFNDHTSCGSIHRQQMKVAMSLLTLLTCFEIECSYQFYVIKTFNISWIKPYSWKFMDLVFHVPKWHKNDKDSQMDI